MAIFDGELISPSLAFEEGTVAFAVPAQFPRELQLNPIPVPTGAYVFNDAKAEVVQTFSGYFADFVTSGLDFFERIHVVPRSFDFGNVITTQTADIEVFSAFRKEEHVWETFVNNAGAGTTLLGQPALPAALPALYGYQMQVQVSTSGPPTVDDTLDFGFDVGATIFVPIEIDRVILWSVQPELPYVEYLQFLTEVLVHVDGTEQRRALRLTPRQTFAWNLVLEDGPERSRIHNTLFEWQGRIFGVPLWHEATRLSAAATAGDLVVSVQSTAFADYRVGGLFLVYSDEVEFDILEVDSFDATSITGTSGLIYSYPVDTLVVPVRTAVLEGRVSGTRYFSSDATMRVQFRCIEEGVDLSDASAFGSLLGKVLLDGFNVQRGTMPELFQRDLVVLDNSVGLTYQDSPWAVTKRLSDWGHFCTGKQEVWEVRQLLHALRGKQISFYLPSFSEDLTLVDDLVSGTAQMVVVNVGYARFVQSRLPRNLVRIIFNQGSPTLYRGVLSAVEDSATEETLTLDDTWPSNFQVEDVERIEFVEKVRVNSDAVQFNYELGDRHVLVTTPVKTVSE